MQRPSTPYLAIGVGLLTLGVIAGTYGYATLHSDQSHFSLIRLEDKRYPLTYPLIGFEYNGNNHIPEVDRVDGAIKSAIAETNSPKIVKVAAYFRDLESGDSTGINDAEKFAPASLLKVITLIAYYKESDTNPSILNDQIYYDGLTDENSTEYYKPPNVLRAGMHSVKELLTRMITYSGNNSNKLLTNHLGQDKIAAVYRDLNIPLPLSTTEYDFLSARDYSYLFRALYNATYLYRDSSEEALELLTQTEFDKGLRPGVPESIPIAHKFGERTLNASVVGWNEGFVHELHDCGIIYEPNDPYFLCVMTQGRDFSDLEPVIQSISKAVYQAVTATK